LPAQVVDVVDVADEIGFLEADDVSVLVVRLHLNLRFCEDGEDDWRRFVTDVSHECRDTRRTCSEQHPPAGRRLAERDRTWHSPTDLAQALDGAPGARRRHREILAALPRHELSESELFRAKQELPFVGRPARDNLGVAADLAGHGHRQGQARVMRDRDAEIGVYLWLAVAAVPDYGSSAKDPAQRDLSLLAPPVAIARALWPVRLYYDPWHLRVELRELALKERAEQRGHPGSAAVLLAHRAQPQALPAFHESSVRVANVQVVGVAVAIVMTLPRVENDLHGAVTRHAGVDPGDALGQQRRVRHAALDRVHEGVPRPRIAKQEAGGEERAEPVVSGNRRDLRDAGRRRHGPVPEDPLEPLSLEQHPAIQVTPRVDGHAWQVAP